MVAAPHWFFGFDSLMEFIGFAIAIAVAYQALKGYRLSNERTLLYINLSFVLLGAGLFIDALSSLLLAARGIHRGLFLLAAFGNLINFAAQALAYGILVVAYVQQTRSFRHQLAMAALPIFLFEHNAIAELVLIFLLAYICIQTAINYSIDKTKNSFLVFAAFASLAISHLFFILFLFAPVFFPFAHIAQLFGFILLLAMLLRVNRSK